MTGPKIIRDGLAGRIPRVALRIASASERRRLLSSKLGEERDEFVASDHSSLEELGDCLAVLRAMADDAGHPWAHVEAAEKAKEASHGAFSRGLVYDAARDPTKGRPS